MPRLTCTFDRFIATIEQHGFIRHRQGATSHRVYRREADGVVHMVVVACHRLSDEIKPGTLASMIRQTGLPKALFRA